MKKKIQVKFFEKPRIDNKHIQIQKKTTKMGSYLFNTDFRSFSETYFALIAIFLFKKKKIEKKIQVNLFTPLYVLKNKILAHTYLILCSLYPVVSISFKF